MVGGPRDAIPRVAEQGWRAYPCPECGELVDTQRVAVVTAQRQFPEHVPPEYAEKYAGASIGGYLQEGGFIATRFGDISPDGWTRHVRYAVRVVSPSVVATMEQRISARQMEVAIAVVEEATQNIRNWGERQAIASINVALDAVAKRRQQRT